jgi:hypothetical protein
MLFFLPISTLYVLLESLLNDMSLNGFVFFSNQAGHQWISAAERARPYSPSFGNNSKILSFYLFA